MFDYLIYDFDGTLSDTYPIFAEAFSTVLTRYNIKNDYDTVYAQLKVSIGYAFSQYNFEEDINLIKKEFSDLRHELGRAKQKAFAESAEILQYALDHQKKNYIYTHTGKFVYELLDKMNLSQYFDFVVDGSYKFPAKPAPDAIDFLCKKCNIDKSRALIIGDRDIDIGAGHAAGIKGCLIDVGNYYPSYPADYRINSLLDLKQII